MSATRSRLPAAERRAAVVDAALRVFGAGTYSGATTAEIAREAGVTEPILYRHFKSKQELFVAIVRDVSDTTMKGWEAMIAAMSDPAEKIRRVAEAIPEHIKKHDDAYHVLHGALSVSRDKKVVAVMKEHYRQIEEFFAKLISDGQKAGVFARSVDPKAAAWQLICAGIGYAMISLNLGQIDKEMTRRMIEAILRGWEC